MDINERFKQLRKSLGLSQEELGNKIGLSKSGISNIESGTRNVTDKHIKLICSEFPINEDWLRTGTGKMERKTPFDTMTQLKKDFNLDEFSFNLVHEYLKLTPTQREKVRDFVYCIIKKENMNCITEIPEMLEEPEIKKYLSNQPVESKRELTLEELEAEYKKSRSVSARKTDLSASNTIKDTELENSDFASNQ